MKVDIHISLCSGSEFLVPSASLSNTILQIKKRIYGIKSFHVDQQMLSLPHETERLVDEIKLSEIPEFIGGKKIALKLTIFYKMIALRIIRPESFATDLVMKIYPCCTVISLKGIVEKHTNIPIADQSLSYNSVTLANEKMLFDYNLKDPEDSMNFTSIEEANMTTTSRPFEINLFVRKEVKGKLSLRIDFSFNTIKNVKKVKWKENAPKHREVTDGMSWFCYCRNIKCEIANELFIVNRGKLLFHNLV
jgi:hypothetical protein